MREKIRVLLVDDHQLILDGLKSLLKHIDNLVVAGEANNGREALRLLDIFNVDVVLMDIDMPVMNGIEALKEIKRIKPLIKVIILSMHNESGMVKNLLGIGADGYLLKSTSQDELIRAITKVANGDKYFSTDVTLALLNHSQSSFQAPKQQIETLTIREEEILKLIAEGFSNREIGARLFISHRTVDTHRTNMMKKLNTANIAGLISYAIKSGLI